MNLLNFNKFELRKKTYGGANGNKLSIIIDDEMYMLKLPVHSTKNDNMSYTSSCICEYLGCHIFKNLGIESQKNFIRLL